MTETIFRTVPLDWFSDIDYTKDSNADNISFLDSAKSYAEHHGVKLVSFITNYDENQVVFEGSYDAIKHLLTNIFEDEQDDAYGNNLLFTEDEDDYHCTHFDYMYQYVKYVPPKIVADSEVVVSDYCCDDDDDYIDEDEKVLNSY